MKKLYLDVLIIILRKLKYDDLTRFTHTTKKYKQIQSSDYYLKKKEKYHNPKEKYTIKRDNGYSDYWNYHYIIYDNNKWLSYIFTNPFTNPLIYKMGIFPDLFDVFGYTKFIFPFVFPDMLLKKIKNRYKDFKITNIDYSHDCYCDLVFDNSMDYSTIADMFQQMNLLFHVFKNYKNEIIIAIYDQDKKSKVQYKENKLITSKSIYDTNLSRKNF